MFFLLLESCVWTHRQIPGNDLLKITRFQWKRLSKTRALSGRKWERETLYERKGTDPPPPPKEMLEPHPGKFCLNESRPVSRQELKLGALTIWMAFSVIPDRIQMERFIPVENFRKKGNTFRGISFFPLLPEFPEFLYHLFTPTVPGSSR